MRKYSRRNFIATASAALGVASSARAQTLAAHEERDLVLWYARPAAQWIQALPIGNGRLGAMVFGGGENGTPDQEFIQLNDDTLWSGAPRDGDNPDAKNYLSAIRDAVLQEHDYVLADQLCCKMQGRFAEAYQPIGNLRLEFDHVGTPTEYRRQLDLHTATVSTQYLVDGTRFEREAFISAPDQVFVLRLTASKSLQLSCTLSMDSPLQVAVKSLTGKRLLLRGKAASHVAGAGHRKEEKSVAFSDRPGEGMYFAAALQVEQQGGTCTIGASRLIVQKASTITVFVTTATGFKDFKTIPDTPPEQVEEKATKALMAVTRTPLRTLRERHVTDYRRLFDRVSLDLGRQDLSRPTDQRLARFESAPDPSVLALYFQFGRYLLISSSRPGSQPANLQGIWNSEITPPWSCNWTANINLQMNYWPVETCNLSECASPLFDLIDDVSVNGARTARENYGMPGWVSHHNIDLWRSTNPVGEGVGAPTWANWAMSGPWLCTHLYEHYSFTHDLAFLRMRAYPMMKECARFCLAWLTEDPQGRLTTCPSESTENHFEMPDGKDAMTSAGCTMDIALIRELFLNCVRSAKELGIDGEFVTELETARKRLVPYQIGKYGQLQEWSIDFKENMPGQRHLSHLYPLYPGAEITPLETPALARAARVSLERRLASGGAYTGWSRAWAIGLWSRLRDGEKAAESLSMLLKASTSPNLMDTHPYDQGAIFQIDGNLGAAAAIAEMLLQSHEGVIDLLPALPSRWSQGRVNGLRARGGVEVNLVWENGKLAECAVRPSFGDSYRFRIPQGQVMKLVTSPNFRRVAIQIQDGLYSLSLKGGEVYRVFFA